MHCENDYTPLHDMTWQDFILLLLYFTLTLTLL